MSKFDLHPVWQASALSIALCPIGNSFNTVSNKYFTVFFQVYPNHELR